MLTENQKQELINHICGLVKESIMENGFYENLFPEGRHKNKKRSIDPNIGKAKKNKKKVKEKDGDKNKKIAVLKWLDTAQELHSVLAYDLWPEKDEDTARSEFSKKYRGHDDDGNPYHFNQDEINTLYNMRSDFIQRAGFHK